MTPVFNALADACRARSGREVEITSADSGELLASIELHLQGDLYVAHDPFMDIAMRRGLGVNAWVLGELVPVMVVQKGNPKHIVSLRDLYRPDVRVYLTDYRHSTLGSGSWAANQLIMKAADAALVWQAVAYLRRDDLDAVRIDDALPRPGVDAVTSATGRPCFVSPVKVAAAVLAAVAAAAAGRGERGDA